MKDRWWKNKAVEVQGYADRHETNEFYVSLKDIYGPTHTPSVPRESADGSTVITEKEQILNRWQHRFSVLLHTPSGITSDALDAVVVHPERNILDTVPTLDEVSKEATAMKNSNAPEADGIPAEMFKHGGVKLQRRLHELFVNIWISKEMPQHFKDSSIIINFKHLLREPLDFLFTPKQLRQPFNILYKFSLSTRVALCTRDFSLNFYRVDLTA